MEPIVTSGGAHAEEAERLWKQFKIGFWSLFVAHIALKGFATSIDPSIAPNPDAATTSLFVIFILGLCVVIAMMGLVGWTSYKLSGKRSHIFNGLLGAIWLATIFIFFAYFAVRNDYHRVLGKPASRWGKVF